MVITMTVPLPVTGAGSANTSSIAMAIGSSSNLGLTPLIRCGLTGIRTSKLFHERRLRPALDDNPGGGGSSPSVRSVGSGSPHHYSVSELKRRGYVPQLLYCLAGASNGERTEIKDATEHRLAHVYAFNLRHE